MYQYYCFNQIAAVGLSRFNDQYVQTEETSEADAILVRSAC